MLSSALSRRLRSSPLLSGPGGHTTAFYVTFFMATGVHLPFWPLWLEHWGLTASEVGLFTALGVGARVVAGSAVSAAPPIPHTGGTARALLHILG